MVEKNKFKCVCCGNYSIAEKITSEVCPVCGWMVDEYQEDHADRRGGANRMSLNEARAAYREGRQVR